MNYKALHELVAERVLGWSPPKTPTRPIPPFPRKPYDNWNYNNPPADVEEWRSNYHWREPTGECWSNLPEFSLDLSRAWKVVDKLRHRFISISTTFGPIQKWCCDFYTSNGFVDESLPMAICISALLAVGVTEEEINAVIDSERLDGTE